MRHNFIGNICGLALVAFLSSAAAQASTVVQGTIGINQWAYLPFSYSGGTLDINVLASSWTGGPTGVGLADSEIFLFADNGSPIGNLTGTLVGFNDDSFDLGWDSDGSTVNLDSIFAFAVAFGRVVHPCPEQVFSSRIGRAD